MQKKILLTLTVIITLLLLSCTFAFDPLLKNPPVRLNDDTDCTHGSTATRYEKYNDSQHTVIKYCKNCNEEISSSRAKHAYIGNKCSLCDYTKEGCSASGTVSGHKPVVREVKQYGITHMAGEHPVNYYCSTCGVSYWKNESCTLVAEDGTYDYDDSNHWIAKICKACGYKEQNGNKGAHQYSKWEYQTDSRHKRKCTICGKTESKEHTLDSKGVCTVCGYSKEHLYGLDGVCVDCGKSVSITGGSFLNISEWYDYSPRRPKYFFLE